MRGYNPCVRHAPAILAILGLLSGCWQGHAADGAFVAPAGSVDVLDGDSLVIKSGRHETEVRLYGIDAPEHLQPWSAEAREALKKLVAGRALRIETVEHDRYERIVARVYRDSDGLYVNAEMVGGGHAWVYRQYAGDRDLLARERRARAQRAGLWKLPAGQRQPPWEWRRAQER